MQAYLIEHISRNKADAEARRMCEEARRANTALYSDDSSFGSGFDGGFSSGGGFSGGW